MLRKSGSCRGAALFGTSGLVLAALGATPVFAQDAQAVQIDELVVTAQRRSENIQDVPIAIQAFSAQAIKDLGIKNPSDLSQFTPNVQISAQAGQGNQPIITIRGIGLVDFNTNNAGPNGVYVDEFYVSAPSAQMFNVFDLERIEVLKGPQGTLYGRNASGGAINLVAAKPTDEVSAYAHAEYGSWNTWSVEGAIGGPIRDGLSGRISAIVNESDGFLHNSFSGTREAGANNLAVRGQLLWQATPDLKVLWNVRGGYLDNRPTEYIHYGSLDPTTGVRCSVAATYAGGCVDLLGYGTSKNPLRGAWNRREHQTVRDIASSLRIEYALPGGFDFVSITGGEYNDKKFPEDSDSSPLRNLEIDFNVKSNEFTQEFRVSKSATNYNFVAGAYYLSEALSQAQPLRLLLDLDKVFGPGAGDGTAEIIDTFNHQSTQAKAVFGQLEYRPTDKLHLIGGLRYTSEEKSFRSLSFERFQSGGADHFGAPENLVSNRNSLSEDKVNWRLGVNYDVYPDVMLFASASTGFKSGGFNGGFLSTDPAVHARQVQPVKPETVTAYEIGVKSRLFDRRVTANVSIFYNDYRNQQVFNLVPLGALTVNVLDNADKAETYGLDADVSAKVTPELTLSAQLGLLHTELVKFIALRAPGAPDYSGNQLPLAPKVSSTLRADWDHPMGDGVLKVQASASYRSDQFFDSANNPYVAQKGYWLSNLRVAYALPDQRWEVGAFVRNIADKRYLVYASDLTEPFGLIQGTLGTPRFIGAEINYRY